MTVRGSVWCLVALFASASTALASPSPSSSKPARKSLALIAVTRGEGLTDREVHTIEEVILASLDATGRFSVVGRTDIDALLTLEAKKQVAGCAGDSGCMAQIAGALGVELVATADVGQLGPTTVLSLKVIDVRTATVVARAQEMVRSEAALASAAQGLAAEIVRSLWPDATGGRARWPAWTITGLTVAGAAFATVESALVSGCPQTAFTAPDLAIAKDCQTTHATAANVGWAVTGAAAITAGTLWLVLGRSHADAPSGAHAVRLDFTGNGVLLSGRF